MPRFESRPRAGGHRASPARVLYHPVLEPEEGGHDMAEGTPEAVALDLLGKMVLCEKMSIGSGGEGGRGSADRKWILDTYAECLLAVKDPAGRLRDS